MCAFHLERTWLFVNWSDVLFISSSDEWYKGSFNNYMDRILPFWPHPPAWTKRDIFDTPLSCPRSYGSRIQKISKNQNHSLCKSCLDYCVLRPMTLYLLPAGCLALKSTTVIMLLNRCTEVYHKAMKMSRNIFVRSAQKSFFQ